MLNPRATKMATHKCVQSKYKLTLIFREVYCKIDCELMVGERITARASQRQPYFPFWCVSDFV